MIRRSCKTSGLSSRVLSVLSVVLCGAVVGAVHDTAFAQRGGRGGGMGGCAGGGGGAGGFAGMRGGPRGMGGGNMAMGNVAGMMQMMQNMQRMQQMQQARAALLARQRQTQTVTSNPSPRSTQAALQTPQRRLSRTDTLSTTADTNGDGRISRRERIIAKMRERENFRRRGRLARSNERGRQPQNDSS